MKKKIILGAVLVVSSVSGFAQIDDTWSRGYVWNAASNSGTDVWYGPGNRVTAGAVGRGAAIARTANGMEVLESGSVALRDGRAVTLAAKRFVPVAELLAGVGRVAGGPYGVAAAVALPWVIDWVVGDNAQNIRIANQRFEKKDNTVCSVAPCQEFQYSFGAQKTPFGPALVGCAIWFSWQNPAANFKYNAFTSAGPGGICYGTGREGSATYPTQLNPSAARPVDPRPPGWLPASMDDIAPYMTPRVPAVVAIASLTALGVELASSPVSVTGPTPALPSLDPYVKTTQYPAPAPLTSTTTQPGNPFNLPSNTPTVTSSATSTTPVTPGSSSATGPTPSVAPPSPGPVNSPSTTTTTSTHNPTTNQTTSTTSTVTAPQTLVQTTNTTTNITNTSNTSNVSNTTTTTTAITNNVTNITTTTTDTKAPASQDPTKSECEKNPDSFGCQKIDLDTPTGDIPKTTKTITYASENLGFGGGSCPANKTMSPHGMAQITVIDWASNCDKITSYAKPMILALAGFAALMIIFAGGKPE